MKPLVPPVVAFRLGILLAGGPVAGCAAPHATDPRSRAAAANPLANPMPRIALPATEELGQSMITQAVHFTCAQIPIVNGAPYVPPH